MLFFANFLTFFQQILRFIIEKLIRAAQRIDKTFKFLFDIFEVLPFSKDRKFNIFSFE